jgi:hypothetical protein
MRFLDRIELELKCVRRLGNDPNLIAVASNMGVYEAVLHIILAGDAGISITETVDAVYSKFTSRPGILNRLKMLREAELIYTVPGPKRSQVNLVASDELIASFERAFEIKSDAK